MKSTGTISYYYLRRLYTVTTLYIMQVHLNIVNVGFKYKVDCVSYAVKLEHRGRFMCHDLLAQIKLQLHCICCKHGNVCSLVIVTFFPWFPKIQLFLNRAHPTITHDSQN